MRKILLIITIIVLSVPASYSRMRNDTLIEKKGWLLYWSDQIVWFESNLKKNPDDKGFFTSHTDYFNGLVVNYIPITKYYKSVANCYSIMSLSSYDTILKKTDYILLDSICILPVKVKFKASSKPVSDLLRPMGLSFKKDNNEITLKYNFETNYEISEVELLRKNDKRKIKRIKNYVIDP